MAREDERVIESFINRGTGELAGRDLQRSNAPQLGASLAESQVTRAQQERTREAERRASENKLKGLARQFVKPTGVSRPSNQPLGMIRSLANTGIPGSSSFELMTKDGGKAFNSIDDFGRFLAENPQFKTNIGFEGIEGIQGLPKELRRQIEQLLTGSPALPSLPQTESNNALGMTGNPSSLLREVVSLSGGFSGKQQEAIALKQEQELNNLLRSQVAKAKDPYTSLKARKGVM